MTGWEATSLPKGENKADALEYYIVALAWYSGQQP